MSLTLGTSPFSGAPAGRFNSTPDPPGRPLYLDPLPYRVRALIAGETVLDSDRASLLHETGHLPVIYAPLADYRADLLAPSSTTTHCPYKGDARYHHVRVGDRERPDAIWSYPEPLASAHWLAPLAALRFDAADTWFCEDAEINGHARDPYHRIDLFPTSRHVRIAIDGVELASSTGALMLCETGLPRRFYLPADDVVCDLFEPSAKHTRCAYKGVASYRTARIGDRVVPDIAWSYPIAAPEVGAIEGRWCFFDEHVDLDLDGVRQARPTSPWS